MKGYFSKIASRREHSGSSHSEGMPRQQSAILPTLPTHSDASFSGQSQDITFNENPFSLDANDATSPVASPPTERSNESNQALKPSRHFIHRDIIHHNQTIVQSPPSLEVPSTSTDVFQQPSIKPEETKARPIGDDPTFLEKNILLKPEHSKQEPPQFLQPKPSKKETSSPFKPAIPQASKPTETTPQEEIKPAIKPMEEKVYLNQLPITPTTPIVPQTKNETKILEKQVEEHWIKSATSVLLRPRPPKALPTAQTMPRKSSRKLVIGKIKVEVLAPKKPAVETVSPPAPSPKPHSNHSSPKTGRRFSQRFGLGQI